MDILYLYIILYITKQHINSELNLNRVIFLAKCNKLLSRKLKYT